MKKLFSYVRKTFRFLLKFKKKVPVFIPKFQSDLLLGRVIFITGGSSGIGYAIAEACLNSGATVIIAGRNQDKLNTAQTKLLQNKSFEGKVYSFILDLSTPDSCETVLLRLNEVFKQKIDTLINCAGIGSSSVKHGSFSSITDKDYDMIMDVNLKGTYFVTRKFAKYMIDNKIQGNILNIGSSSCLRPASSAYALSKWGIRGFTLGLAKTLIPYGIVVNGIAPGPTSTPMHVHGLYQPGEDLDSNTPIGRDAVPEEIANFAVVMVSSMGRMIVGDMVYMTGGSGIITYDDVSYTI